MGFDGMNINEPPQYLQQLLGHTTDGPMILKEEDHDYSTNSVPFLNDCGYFAQQNSPTEQHFPNLQSPTNNFQNGSGLYSPATCSSNIQVLNPVQNSLPSMNSRSRMNNYSQSRMGMNSALLLNNNIEQLPDTTIFPGSYDFQLSLGPHTESATKSADYTYSPMLKKLYVQRGSHCPFKFKTSSQPPPNTYVKILPVFKGTHVLSEPVRRCSNHAEGDDDGNPRYHFIRANNRQTVYDSSDGGRLFLTIPFTGPQVGAEFQVELLSFMCFNSCGHSSHSKRRIDIIFMLENNGQVLGRQVIEVRVCACPGRDRSNEEGVSSSKNGMKPVRRGCSFSGPGRGGKRRKFSSGSEQEYTIKTTNPMFHQILQQILDTLEAQIPRVPDIPAIRNHHSPASADSSPGNVFKSLHETESTDEEVM